MLLARSAGSMSPASNHSVEVTKAPREAQAAHSCLEAAGAAARPPLLCYSTDWGITHSYNHTGIRKELVARPISQSTGEETASPSLASHWPVT